MAMMETTGKGVNVDSVNADRDNGGPVLNWSDLPADDRFWSTTARAGDAILIAFPYKDGWEWQIHKNNRLIDRGGASTMTRARAMAERHNTERKDEHHH